MKKSAYYSNIFFAFLATTVSFLCVLRYLQVGLALACVFGVIAGTCAACACALLLKNKRDTGLRKADDERLKEKFLLHLLLLPTPQQKQTLCALFEACMDGEFLQLGQNVVALPLLFLRELTPDDVLPLFRKTQAEKKIILCNRINAEAAALCQKFNVEIVDGTTIFQQAKEKNLLPSIYVSEPFFTKQKPLRWKLCFAKSNSKRFFVGGIFILLSSLITPFPYYYLIVGFFLLGLAVFTKIFGED